jgi:hypothetical protein
MPARVGVARDLAVVKEEDCRVLFAKPNPLGIVLWTTGGFAFSAGAFLLKRLGARGFPPRGPSCASRGPCHVGRGSVRFGPRAACLWATLRK